MTWRAVSLTAAAVLAASLAGRADTPTASPSPKPSPRARSLGEVARDKKTASPAAKTSPSPEPSPGRVFTNEDLPVQPSPPAIASPGPAGAGRGTVTTLPKTAALPTPSPDAAAAEAAQQEILWRGRADNLRFTIAATEKNIAELEDKIAAIRNDRSPTNLMDPNREQTRQAEMAKAQAQLESAQSALAAARQAQSDLEEEARRKGIPPGWLRER